MSSTRASVRIAINVMRARLTLLGFNIAIASFQINEIARLDGGARLPGIEQSVHLPAAVTLFLALALSFIAMVLFIASGGLDQEGLCTHWSLLAGDLLMYLAMAHTLSGFFQPFAFMLDEIALADPAQAQAFAVVRSAVVVAGGAAWVMAVYLGPLVSLLRSPFGARTTTVLGGAYLVLTLVTAWIWATAAALYLQLLGSAGAQPSLLAGLLQPLCW